MDFGSTPEFKRWAIRPTMVEVFPVPAEAIIRLCPKGAVAAERCSSFNALRGN
jgi:hypothetical protein